MAALPHLTHLSLHSLNTSSLILFPRHVQVYLLTGRTPIFPLVLNLFPQLSILFFPHHSNADYIHHLISPALPGSASNHQGHSPPYALLSQLIPQILSDHMVNLIHIPLGAPAPSARQQVVAAGNPNKSPFPTATDCPYRVARLLMRLKWNVKNYLTVNEEKTLSSKMVNFSIALPEYQNQYPSLRAHTGTVCPHFNLSAHQQPHPPSSLLSHPLTLYFPPFFYVLVYPYYLSIGWHARHTILHCLCHLYKPSLKRRFALLCLSHTSLLCTYSSTLFYIALYCSVTYSSPLKYKFVLLI